MALLLSSNVSGNLNVTAKIYTQNIDVANGTITNPSLGFLYVGSQSTGIYLAGNNILGLVSNGNGIINVAQTSVNISNQAVLNVLSNIFSGNVITTSLYANANVFGNSIFANSNANSCIVMSTVAVRPLSITTANTTTIYAKNVANLFLIHHDSTLANNTNYDIDVAVQKAFCHKSIAFVGPSLYPNTTNTGCYMVNGNDRLSINIQANTANSAVPMTNANPIFKNLKARIQLGANNLINANAVMLCNSNTTLTGLGLGSGNGGGFLYTSVFTLDTLVANNRFFNGICNLTAFPTGDLDPRINTIYTMVGVGSNTNSGNWQFIAGANGQARVVTDLGTSFNINTSDVLELTMFFQPGGAAAGYRLRNKTNGAETSGSITAATSLPTANQWVQPFIYIQTNSAACTNISVYNAYLEKWY